MTVEVARAVAAMGEAMAAAVTAEERVERVEAKVVVARAVGGRVVEATEAVVLWQQT